MSQNESMRQYFTQQITIGERERYVEDIAREYHERTEAYDRKVCTGPVTKDGIMPRTREEFLIINRHAIMLLKDLQQRALLEREIPAREVFKAIGRYES